MIALAPSGVKYDYIMAHPELNIKVVTPHWFQLCCNTKRLFSEIMYQFPNPPIQEDDPERYPTPIQGNAPLLYSNGAKHVLAFFNSPNENLDQFLEKKYIFMANDVLVLPELRDKFEERISQAGGFLVNEYSSDMVDIVICRLRAGDIYFEASNEGKIVASLDWLYHVLCTGTIPSPKASLLHYPIPADPIPGMTSLVMTVSNYSGPIREYLKRLIIATGATYKTTLSSRSAAEPTTHIICGDASGEKYEKGNEWNVKVVNHFWLEDCFLTWCMQSETKPRYTLFPVNNQLPYVFGTGMPPEMIEEWTSPDDFEDALPQTEIAEAGVPSILVQADDSGGASGSLTDDIATGDEELEDEKQHVTEIRDTRQTSEDSTPIVTAEAYSSSATLSPRKTAPKKGGPSIATSVVNTTTNDVISPMESVSLSSNQADSSAALPCSHGPGSVRVVSRKREAALEASKALQQIVPDMNEFQEELRDEKRRKKRNKTAPTEDSSMDVDGDDVESAPSTNKKVSASPVKRKRVSMGTVALDNPSTPIKSQEDTGNESEEAASDVKTPTKKARRNVKVEKHDVAIALAEPTSTSNTTTPLVVSKTKRVRYITTGIDELSAKQIRALKAIGIASTTSMDQSTHLVAKNVSRTEKFLNALAQGKVIVHEDWLQACIDANAILDENNYQIKDTENEAKFGMKLQESLELAREKKVFENCVFYISPSTVPKLAALKMLVEAGGGKATALLQTGLGFLKDRIVKNNAQKEAIARKDKGRQGQKNKAQDEEEDEGDEEEEEILAVVSCEDDKDMWQPILDTGAKVYSHELIIFGILRQHLDLGNTHALA
ncbi:hypothetical protein FBU30_004579 [Linnemannia zychae]|nr:hypothetical protein FBU30_004579 [Linnemannia zychae]